MPEAGRLNGNLDLSGASGWQWASYSPDAEEHVEQTAEQIYSGIHFVVTMGGRILEIANQGAVRGRDVNGTTIGEAFVLPGAPVAAQPHDRFVLTMGHYILVITNAGEVWRHAAIADIGEASRLAGPPVAAQPHDHFVLTMGLRILVITNEGEVWGHDVNGTTIGEAFMLPGPPIAAVGHTRFVVTMGHLNRIFAIANDGQLSAYDV